MQLTELNTLFEVKLGNKFDANKMNFVENGEINFISRNSRNNGCVGKVTKYGETEPFREGLITVSLGSHFPLSSFVQPRKFYTAQNVAVLRPLREMKLSEKIYYCKCISTNRFKYSAVGREANRTLSTLRVPKTPPSWLEEYGNEADIELRKPCSEQPVSLDSTKWGSYAYSDLFDIRKGKRLVVSKNSQKGTCPFVSASDKNNGISDYLNILPEQEGNTITVCYNGSIGEAFYQPNPFWPTDDINVLYPKFPLNPLIAMFLVTLIRKEKFKFNYGRKWYKERMEKSTIRLPVNQEMKPDWDFIEKYIKSLSYSSGIAFQEKAQPPDGSPTTISANVRQTVLP